MNKQEIFKLTDDFQKEAINITTKWGSSTYDTYNEARAKLIEDSDTCSIIPEWVLDYSDGYSFRGFMQKKYDTWVERRSFINKSLGDFKKILIGESNSTINEFFYFKKGVFRNININDDWRKIILRSQNDPEGAITLSKSMLESVLKHILDEYGVIYDEKIDCIALYKEVSKCLKLSPKDHHEEIFKQVLGGVASVVQGFSAIRNKYGDAHGKDNKHIKPSSRHSDLVVNLSGTICIFLLETLKVQKSK